MQTTAQLATFLRQKGLVLKSLGDGKIDLLVIPGPITQNLINSIELKDLDLSKKNLSGLDFSGKTIINVRFDECQMEGTILSQCTLIKTSFRFARCVAAELIQTNIQESCLDGGIFLGADFKGFQTDETTSFHGANFWQARNLPDNMKDRIVQAMESTWS